MLQRGKEVKILSFPTITAEQISASLLAIPAFLPATLCTGYLAAWFTNLHNFRQRSMVERIFWSVPLSIAVSTIASVLIGKFFSLAAVVVFLVATAALWLVVIGNEWFQLRGNGRKWNIGWSPLGGTALMLAILWIVVAVFSLVDLESNHHLFMNTAILDQCFRIDWTDSVLRTGVPPANPLYFYKSPAIMRNYYFWYVICAVVAKMAHLPVRAVFVASSVWAGFLLASLNGLFLKHFLAAGAHLRRQFLRSVLLPYAALRSRSVVQGPGHQLVRYASLVSASYRRHGVLHVRISAGMDGRKGWRAKADGKRGHDRCCVGKRLWPLHLRDVRILPGDGGLGSLAGRH